MRTVNDRLTDLEKEVIRVRRILDKMIATGHGIPTEFADLRTIGKMFGNYSVATLRQRINDGVIPSNIIRRDDRKILVNVKKYREFIGGGE